MNDGNRLLNRRTLDALNVQRHDQVLEIGMGNGLFVKDLFRREPSLRYTGCDYSTAMIEVASRQNQPLVEQGGVRFILADANLLPFADQAFDQVFTINTIYFWDYPDQVLSEIHRVLKPRGKITIALRPKGSMQHYPFVQFGFAMFTPDEVARLLESNGFEVINLIEQPEPDREFNGTRLKIDTLIVQGVTRPGSGT